jgi:hypothetical protein
MAYIPKRVLYGDFPDEGIYGITARQALEAAIDGHMVAYHLVPTPVTVYEHTTGEKYVGTDLGKWHGLTIRVPRGVLYHLSFNKISQHTEPEGKPAALSVEGPLGTPDMPANLPEKECYLLWPEDGGVLHFDRDGLFFMSTDLKQYAEANHLIGNTFTQSDAALGAAIRQKHKDFATRLREEISERETEYQRWRDAGAKIQNERNRPASKRDLAKLIQSKLGLPDSSETIRKKL